MIEVCGPGPSGLGGVMRKAEITPELAARLVASQFPQWADLPISRVAQDGHDNTTFHLGAALSVRLPSGDAYSAQVAKEQLWLPRLAPQLPLPIPEPVAEGKPTPEFRRPWSVYRWIEGETVNGERVGDREGLARDLAGFLRALYAAEVDGGPRPGFHNFFRGGEVVTYEGETLDAIDVLAARGELDGPSARAVSGAARDARWERRAVWVHGDVAAGNLLVDDTGQLSAVIDFGCAAVGDPACDLTIAWTLFEGASREAFREGVDLDGATWARARGWALWKAAIRLVASPTGAESAAQRGVIADVLAEHAALS